VKTYRELQDHFYEHIRPAVVERYGQDDHIALNEAWNDYTDAECKDGQINGLVYHHCPSVGSDEWPGDTEEMIDFLMRENGISVEITEVSERPAGFFDDVPGARHFSFAVLDRDDKTVYSGHYSQGPGIHHEPTAASVFASVLMDCTDEPFEDWCDELGFDNDSIKAHRIWEACRKSHQRIQPLVGASDFEDWKELAHEL